MSEMEVDNNNLAQLFLNIKKDDSEFPKICAKLEADIVSTSYTILQLVEDLGIYLIDSDPAQREFGTLILSTVLQLIPDNFLSSTQLNFVTTFYADRLKDHHEVIPAVLKGIVAIAKHINLPEGSYATLLTAFFHNVPCQQQQQQDRFVVYNMFETMLKCRADELKAIGMDFVYGVISAMDGERDPRNLLYLFGCMPTFLKTVKLGHLTEEMFEVLSCYFPVDFRVPPEQANKVTRDELAEALAPCLCGIPDFAEFCIPLALEKLQSTLRIAKLDSLELLNIGCSNFPSDSYMQHSTEILSELQKLVLNNNDPELETRCLSTLTSIIAKLSKSNSTMMFKETISNVYETLQGNLRPDAKLFEPTIKLLLSISKGSTDSSEFITSEATPLLINLFKITETEVHKILIFKTLMQFTEAYIATQNNHNLTNNLAPVPQLCLNMALDFNPQLKANGLIGLSKIPKSLPNDLRRFFYTHFTKLLTESQTNAVHEAAIKCLKSFANVYPNEIKESIASTQSDYSDNFLKSISAISTHPQFREQILTIIIDSCVNNASSAIGLEALKNILQEHEEDDALQKFLIENNVIATLLTHVNDNTVTLFEIKDISIILQSIVGAQTIGQQKLLIPAIENTVAALNDNLTVYILYGLISRLRREVLQDFNVMAKLLDIVLDEICEEDVYQVALELLANMVNKLENEETVNLFLNELNRKLDGTKSDKVHVDLTAWILKSLIMREHDSTDEWIDKLLRLLQRCEQSATAFKIVMHDEYNSLSVKSFCNKRLLYRQRFFMQIVDALCDNYTDNKNNLLALGFMLEEVPEAVLKIHFEKAIRLIVICMDTCEHPRVLISILTTIKSFISNKDELAHKYLQEFIPRLLKLAEFKLCMKVRVISLQCLQNYTDGFVLYKLLLHKTQVITTLGHCLDDHKRLVRKEAADTRLKWYLIDAPV